MIWLKRIGKIGGALLLLPLVGIGVHYGVKAFTHRAPEGPDYRGKAVTEWIDELESPIVESGEGWGHVREFLEQPDRRTARRVLEVMGPVAVPYLIEALDDERKTVRRRCMHVLGDLGPEAYVAVPKLAAALREDESVRSRAAYTLKDMGPSGVEALIDALAEPASREAAFSALSLVSVIPERGIQTILRMPEEAEAPSAMTFHALRYDGVPPEQAVAVCLRCLEREDRRVLAAQALAGLHSDGVEVPTERVARILLADIREKPNAMRVYALLQLGEHAWPATSALVELVDRHDRLIVHWAQQALRHIGPAVAPHADEFLARARHTDPEVRETAILVLGAMGPDAEEALYALLGALEDEALGVRAAACQALALRPDAADVVVPTLERLLLERADLRLYAAALATLGENVPSALQALARIVKTHPDAEVRLNTLGALRGKQHTSLYVVAARDTDARVRRLAAARLSREPDVALVPAYIELLSEPQAQVQMAWALGKLGDAARNALPRLEALRDEPENEARIRGRAAAAVLQVAPDRSGAGEALAAFVDADDAAVRLQAIRACWRLEVAPPSVTAAVRRAAARAEPDTASTAVSLLVHIGAANQEELYLYLDAIGRPDPRGGKLDFEHWINLLTAFARRASFDPVPLLEREIAELRRPLDVLLIARRAVTEIRLERLYGEGWRE